MLIGVALALACAAGVLPRVAVAAAAASSPEALSAAIYRLRLAEVQQSLADCRQAAAQAAPGCAAPVEPAQAAALQQAVAHAEAQAAYARRYYAQEAERRDLELAIHRWQIMAANVVLGLVALLTVAAVAFCGWQLWRAARMSQLPPDAIELEVSVQRLKLQTSVVGLAVLVAAYGFLLVFTREVYQARPIESPPPAASGVAVP